MEDLFLIKGETIKNIADSVRDCLGQENYVIDPAVIEEPYVLVRYAVQPIYYEFIDMEEDLYAGLNDWTNEYDIFVAYDFLENNVGMVVPVLYKTHSEDYPDEPDFGDQYFYECDVEIDGQLYNKWRKIDSDLPWEGPVKCYIYTDLIVLSSDMSPQEIPDKVREASNKHYFDGYFTGKDEGYAEGYTAGVSATKWIIQDSPERLEGSSTTEFSLQFISNNQEFVKIVHTSKELRYYSDETSYIVVYDLAFGWRYDAVYKIITTNEEIADPVAQEWLALNTTQSGGEQQTGINYVNNSASAVSESAFEGFKNLETVSFPRCKSIERHAFGKCEDLTEATFFECTVSSYAFASCSKLAIFTMLSGRYGTSARIYSKAFQDCSSLERINLYPKQVVGLQSADAFTAIPEIYVHPEVYNNYFSYKSEWAAISSHIYPLSEEQMALMQVDEENEE